MTTATIRYAPRNCWPRLKPTGGRRWTGPMPDTGCLRAPELAEVQDVGEAVANYWQAIGVPIQIEERELAYAAEQFFARKISGIAWTDATPFRETDREQLRIIYASAGCCEFYSRRRCKPELPDIPGVG